MNAARILSAALVLCPTLAGAQSTPTPAPPEDKVEYLSRFAFHFGAERLADADPKFVWDANYGGDVDLVDYRRGRAIFYANYQVMLGEELRDFDPNQGNYILGTRVSARLPGVEAALAFHHQSRHLSDREKEMPIDWNMLGAHLSRTFMVRTAAIDAHADLRWVVKRSFVDYEWEIESGARGRHPISKHVSIVSEVVVRYVGVDGSAGRDGQFGARGEAGLRLGGRAAGLELFVAAERRIDPYPTALGTATWASAGFRFVSP